MSDNQPTELTFTEYKRRSASLQSRIRAAEHVYATATDPFYTTLVDDYGDVVFNYLRQVRTELAALKTQWDEQHKQNRVRK